MSDKVVLKVELDRETYLVLKERARRAGYALVSDYVREVLVREAEASSPGGGVVVDERRLADAVARRIERVVADLVNPFTGKIDEVSRRVAELIERLEEGGHAEREHVEAVQRGPEQRQYPRGQRVGAIERLRQQGVVFWDDVGWMKAPDRLFAKLEKEGAIVFEVHGEKVAVDKDFWSRFVSAVEEIGVRDPEEAAVLVESAVGERGRRLFEKLVSSGMVYYDEDLGHWIVPEP